MLYAGVPPDPADNQAPASAATGLPILTFEDGLGWRYRVDTGGPVHTQPEILCFRSEFTDIPSFEFALRERVAALGAFRHHAFARIRSVARLNDELAKIGLVSGFVDGLRLSEILADVDERRIPLDVGTAIYVVRQVLSALTALHHTTRIAHGGLGPERVIITPDAQLTIVEYALGGALEQLRYSREQHWKRLRIALPAAAGVPKFNECADITQAGAIALALLLGRLLRDEEYLAGAEDLVAAAAAVSAPGWSRNPPGLRDWLRRALQLDSRHSFSTVAAASASLDEVVSREAYRADHNALRSFLARYNGSREVGPATNGGSRISPVVWTPAPSSTPPAETSSSAVETEEAPTMAPRSRAPRRRRTWLLALLVLMASGVLFAQPDVLRVLMSRQATGMLEINTSPEGALIVVDGIERGRTPAQISLAAGEHAVEVRVGGESRLRHVTVGKGATVSHYLELQQPKALTGQLQIATEPPGAHVSIDGQPRGTSPIIANDLTPGEHVVSVANGSSSVNQAVKIEAGMTASLVVPLAVKAVPSSGWLTLSSPANLQLYENGRLLGSTDIDRIMLPAGRHEIEVVNNALGFRSKQTVNVAPGKTSTVSIALPKGVMSVNATPWASVLIDGESVGDTPLGNLPVTIGTHEVVFRHPQLGEQRRVVTVTLNGPARLSIDLSK